jgi:hypothetical protein
MVAEQVRQLVRLIGHLADRRRPGLAHDPQLVPEVLDPFAPLVHALGARPRARPLPFAPATAVAAQQARLDQLPGAGLERPARDRGDARRERGARLLDPRPDLPLRRAGYLVALAFERGAPHSRRRGRHRVAEALPQRRQRLDLDLGVAARRQQAAGVAVVPVLGAEGLLAELVADQAQHGAQLLHLFARGMDRLGKLLAAARAGQFLAGRLGPPAGDPPHAVGHGLLALQPVGAALALDLLCHLPNVTLRLLPVGDSLAGCRYSSGSA